MRHFKLVQFSLFLALSIALPAQAGIPFGKEEPSRRKQLKKIGAIPSGEMAVTDGCYDDPVYREVVKYQKSGDRGTMYAKSEEERRISGGKAGLHTKIADCFAYIGIEKSLAEISVQEYKAKIASSLSLAEKATAPSTAALAESTWKEIEAIISNDEALKRDPGLFSRYSEVLPDFYPKANANQREFLRHISRKLVRKQDSLPAPEQFKGSAQVKPQGAVD